MAPTTRRTVPVALVALVTYLALAVVVFRNVWDAPTRDWISRSLDPPLFIWHFRWLPFAVGNGHDPLISNYLNYPDGFNLMWNTSLLFPAFVLSPVTLALGPIFSYNLFGTVALALSAWCAYLAFRRYVRRPVAAALGGLLYCFSPFMFAQGGHLHVTFALYPPIVLLSLDEILIRQRRSPYVSGILLGVATSIQVLTGEELVAISFLVGCLAVVLLAILHRRNIRPRLPYAARAIGTAGAVALALVAYPLYVQFFGTERVTGPIQPQGVFVFDLLQFVVPGPGQALTFDSANDLFARFRGTSELGGYIGLPLLLLTAFVIVRYWSDQVVRFFAFLLGAVVILGFGPRLHVAGQRLALPLPWVIPQRLPVFESILPSRLALIMFLLLGLLLAVFVDRFPLRSAASRASMAAIVAVALVPLFPALPYESGTDDTPAFFSSGADRIPEGTVALVAPLASGRSGTSISMVWQARAEMRFRMIGGYIIRPGATFESEQSRPLLQRMIQIQAGTQTQPLTDAERRQILCQLDELDVRTVVVGPMKVGRPESIALFRRLLGRPPIETGGVQLWPDALVGMRRRGGGCP
jgi:hypothetical protein